MSSQRIPFECVISHVFGYFEEAAGGMIEQKPNHFFRWYVGDQHSQMTQANPLRVRVRSPTFAGSRKSGQVMEVPFLAVSDQAANTAATWVLNKRLDGFTRI